MPGQVRQGLLLTLVGLVVFLTGLGSTHLWDDDETFFAEVAREMNERDDMIVPWFNQRLFAHKPPFMYWMMIGAYRLFGVTEFAARFPSVLFGLATVLLVWRMGRMLYSPRAGLWAAVVLATNLNFTVIARAATSDAELSFFCTLALYLFVRGTAVKSQGAGVRGQGSGGESGAALVWRAGETDWQPTGGTMAMVYAVMGIAVLVKGPIGVLLPTSILGLFLLWMKKGVRSSEFGMRNINELGAGRLTVLNSALRIPHSALLSPRHLLRTIWTLRPLTALAAMLMVAGPWYLAVSLKTDGAFLAGFFGVHHFGRFLNPMDNHPGPAWYYLAAMCVGFFPWVVFLSPTLIHWYRRIRDRHEWHPADVLCGAWCLVWFGFFSLASTKFPHYVVPAYPALALVTAAFLDRWMDANEIYGRYLRRSAWVTVGIAGVGIMVVVPMIQQTYLQVKGFAGLTGLPLIAGAVAGAYFTERGRISAALAGLAGSAAAFLVMLFAFAAVEIDQHQNSEILADAIRAHAGNERPQIGHFHYFRPGLSFYCREHIEPQIRPEDAVSFLRKSPPRYLLTSSKLYDELKTEFPADAEILLELPWFLKQGKGVVLLGRRGGGPSGGASGTVGEREENERRRE
jgi:4-amino-4-deoxy-L-arabinose transferase-like glycosyltransferase